MIVCFDTNVLVSAVATRGLCADIVNAALAEHQLIVGQTVIAELRQVLSRKLRLPVAAIDELEAFLRMHATVIVDRAELDCPALDSGDRAVVAEALAGHTDVLVTGDSDMLEVASQLPLRVLSPRGFWDVLRTA